jgi:hypothetical protein
MKEFKGFPEGWHEKISTVNSLSKLISLGLARRY